MRRHLLGTEASSDALVYEEPDDSFYLAVDTSKSREYLFIDSQSTVASELRCARADDPALAFRVLEPRAPDHEYEVDHAGGRFVIRSNWQARNFRLLQADPASPGGREHWRELLPHDEDVLIEGFDAFDRHLVVSERSDPGGRSVASVLRRSDRAGNLPTGRVTRTKRRRRFKRVIEWNESEGFLDKAIAMLRMAQRLDRRDLDVSLHLAELYLGKEVKGDALRLLEGARKAFRPRRFVKDAIAVEEKILSIAPDDFRAQVSFVRLLRRAGRRYEAGERLWQMEAHWARLRNKDYWKKTPWLLCRHAPSVSTCWGSFISLFTSPVPYGGSTRGRVKGETARRR